MSVHATSRSPSPMVPTMSTAPHASWLSRKCACGGHIAGSQLSCENCQKRNLQARLRVTDQGDALEHEADRAADAVMDVRVPSSLFGAPETPPVVIVQRDASENSAGTLVAPAIVEDVLRSPGAPLDADTRDFFEPRFGHDFSHIRIHTGPTATASADAIDAHAYAVGDHVVFGASQFSPSSQTGRHLLAHELAHTIQQGDGTRTLARQPKGGPARGEEMEVLEKPAVPKTKEDAPWFVWEEKSTQKWELPKGTRVEAKGKPVADNRGGERVLFRTVKILSLPDKLADERNVVGKTGAVPERFLSKVIAPIQAPTKQEPQAQALPAQEVQTQEYSELTQRALDRYKGLPEKVKWPSPLWATRPRSPKADTAVRLMLTARDFYCNEPYDGETGRKVLDRVKLGFTDLYLTPANFDKQFREKGGLTKQRLRDLMDIGISGVHQMISKTKSGQVSAGHCGGTWDFHLSAFVAAYEVMAVLAGDLDIKDAKNIQALDTMMSLKGPQAFLSGLLDGARSELSDEDHKRLANKLSDSSLLSLVAPPIIAAGAAVGIGKDVVDTVKGLYELLNDPEEIIKNMAMVISTLMTDEEGSRALGAAIGAQEAKALRDMSQEDIVTFTYKLGEKIGPTVVYTILSIVTGGVASGVAYSARLAAFLENYPKTLAYINRIKGFVKKKPKVDVDAPHSPKATDAPAKPKAPKKASALEDLNPENQKLMDEKPKLKKDLDEHPLAARALKFCNSPCFPDFATTRQIKRINAFLEQAVKHGWDIDNVHLRKFLHLATDETHLTELIDDLEGTFSKIKDRKASPTLDAVIDETELLEQGGVRQQKPVDVRLAEAKEGQRFDEKMSSRYEHNQVPIRDKRGSLRRLDSYDPDRNEIVSRKSLSANQGQIAFSDEGWIIDYLQEFSLKYPDGATISSGPLKGKILKGKYVLEVPVQKYAIPERILKEAKARGVTIRDRKWKVYE